MGRTKRDIWHGWMSYIYLSSTLLLLPLLQPLTPCSYNIAIKGKQCAVQLSSIIHSPKVSSQKEFISVRPN